MYVWRGTNLGWIEFRGEIPLNPAVVERPVVGRPLTRWKIQFARLRTHQHSLLLLLSNNAADRVCPDERLVSCSFNPITSFMPQEFRYSTRSDPQVWAEGL